MVRLVRLRSSPRLRSPRHSPGTNGWPRITAGDSWSEEDKVFISVLEAVGRAAQRPGVRTLVGSAPASAPKRVNTALGVGRAGHGPAGLLSVKGGESWDSSIAPSSAPERRGPMAGTLSHAGVGSGYTRREKPANGAGATGAGGAPDDEDPADDVPPPDFWPLPRGVRRDRDAVGAATVLGRAAAFPDGHASPADLASTPGATWLSQGRGASSTAGGATRRYSPAVSSRGCGPGRTEGGAPARGGDDEQDERKGVVKRDRRHAEKEEEGSTQATERPGTGVSPGRAGRRQGARAEKDTAKDGQEEEEDKARNGKGNRKKGKRPEHGWEPPSGGVPGACDGQPPGQQGDGRGPGSVGIGGHNGSRANSVVSRHAHDAGARATSVPSSDGGSSKQGDDYRRTPTEGGDDAPTESLDGPRHLESDRTQLPWEAATMAFTAAAMSSVQPLAGNLPASSGVDGLDGFLDGAFRAAAVGVLGYDDNIRSFRTLPARAPGVYGRSWNMSWGHR